MQKLIGTNYFNYAQIRNFVQLQDEKYRFILVKDVFKLSTNIIFKFTERIYSPLQFLFFSLKNTDIHLYHFFNTIPLSNKPWVITFETSLPRLGKVPKFFYDRVVRRLAHSSCKKIIAMSECAAQIQKAYLLKHYSAIADAIIQKMLVLHPPQPTLIESVWHKTYDHKIIFSLVGSDFFRKGGKEVLEVFDKLITQRHNIHLNIISTLEYGDYASHSTTEDYQYALDIIDKQKESITHYKSLTNDKVLQLLRNSHVGLLPTYADTYGYSVLEAQAAGCPVITTNVRALPEINNNECGWMIELPKDESGNAKLISPEERLYVSKTIRSEMEKIILAILQDVSVIQIKGELSLERIRRFHDPKEVAEKLRLIYDEASN